MIIEILEKKNYSDEVKSDLIMDAYIQKMNPSENDESIESARL